MVQPNATILCGRYIANLICQSIKTEVAQLLKVYKVQPKVTVIEIGHREDSALFISQKQKWAAECGIELQHLDLPSSADETSVVGVINGLNSDASVHGIVIQLPMECEQPIKLRNALDAISPEKDVDGLGRVNIALLSREDVVCPHCGSLRIEPLHIPCTAAACFTLIQTTNFRLKGAHCVVVGRGRLVGAPVAELLLGPGRATVTQCHEHSTNLAEQVGRADLVVGAAGCPHLIKGDWLKSGALVLDCGYNVRPSTENPAVLTSVGDVEYERAIHRASWITPVPGGVGPVSVAMLFRNTLNSALWSVGVSCIKCTCHTSPCSTPSCIDRRKIFQYPP